MTLAELLGNNNWMIPWGSQQTAVDINVLCMSLFARGQQGATVN